MPSPLSVLLVEDDPDLRAVLEMTLGETEHAVTSARDGAEALALLSSTVFDVMVSDIRLPHVDGMTLFRSVGRTSPSTDVILMSAQAQVSDAVAAMKEGAFDYLAKPFDRAHLLLKLAQLAERRGLLQDLAAARAQLSALPAAEIVGASPSVQRLHAMINTLAQSSAPVVITGETGTGKELVARLLHERSSRASRPFVAVNCAAFPETLIEAELFGHERGAFTGAVRKRDGRLKAAQGGTLLLDEVAEIPLPVQAKLLRVLQEGTIEPLGADQSIQVDVRIISATHRNLKEQIAAGRFREDLYYRLHVLDIYIPPLRERRGDLPLLLQHFLRRFAPAGRPQPTISPRALAALSHHPFPGNVRELAHAVERACLLAAGGEIDLQHLPPDIAGSIGEPSQPSAPLLGLSAALKEFEREYLVRVLAMANGKRLRAAEMLGISRKNLWEKLRLHGLASSNDSD